MQFWTNRICEKQNVKLVHLFTNSMLSINLIFNSEFENMKIISMIETYLSTIHHDNQFSIGTRQRIHYTGTSCLSLKFFRQQVESEKTPDHTPAHTVRFVRLLTGSPRPGH